MGENKGLLRFLKLDGVVDNLVHLVESKIELAKLETKEEIAVILSKMAVFALLLTFGLFFLVFVSIALAYYLSALVKSAFLGFLIVSGIYLTLFLTIFLLRGRIGLQDVLLDWMRKNFLNK